MARYGNNVGIGFRLMTVPEPSSVVLAAVGLAGLIVWGWQRGRLTMRARTVGI